jgi:limonene-1,2-epoxide hydrolase
VGPDAIRATLAGFTAGVEQVEFRIVSIAADGGTVLTERVDVFRLPGKDISLPVMGTFDVVDGKIAAWRDYFDMNQFMSQLA